MYNPSHFREESAQVLHDFIRAHPLATLVDSLLDAVPEELPEREERDRALIEAVADSAATAPERISSASARRRRERASVN